MGCWIVENFMDSLNVELVRWTERNVLLKQSVTHGNRLLYILRFSESFNKDIVIYTTKKIRGDAAGFLAEQ